MPSRIQSNGSCQTSLVGMQIGIVTMESTLSVSAKIKHALTISYSNSRLGYLTKSNENSCSHKILYINVYSDSIHNHQKKEKKL